MMFRALVKKQFLELFKSYFTDRRTGKRRSALGMVGMFALFIYLFGVFAVFAAGSAVTLAGAFIPLGYNWLYYTMMGAATLVLGVIGSVFTTYNMLYVAKDNDMLLSMPIKPQTILLARMTSVYLIGLLYEAVIFIPSFIVYLIFAGVSATAIVFPIIVFILISLVALVLSCALGFLVALVASRVKNKSLISVILSLGFLGVYFFVYYNAMDYLEGIASRADELAQSVKQSVYPLYMLGNASVGGAVELAVFAIVSAVLLSLTIFILSRTFIKIATTKVGEKKAVYKAKKESSSIEKALLSKEFRRFTKCPSYMLNAGLGVVLMLILSVAAIIKADTLRSFVGVFGEMGLGKGFAVLLVAAATSAIASMDAVTAPSISLEGNNIWILRSMPLDPMKVLNAKQKLHIFINTPPAVIMGVTLSIIIGASALETVIVCLTAFSFICLTSVIGLLLDLRKPMLVWTNEAIPVKQNLSVLVSMFSGTLLLIVFVGVYAIIGRIMPFAIYGILMVIFIAIIDLLFNMLLAKKCGKWFSRL